MSILRTHKMVIGGLFAVFILPIVLAVFVYQSGWQPTRTANHGELLQPPLKWPRADWRSNGALNERPWIFLAIASHCDQSCTPRIKLLRNAHTALGKLMLDINRVLVDIAPAESDWSQTLAQPKLIRATLPDSVLQTEAFAVTQTPGVHVFVIDPHDFAILKYAPQSDLSGLIKDMERLLKRAL